MKLIVKQKILAFGKQYRAFDETGNQVLDVTSMLYSPERRKEVLDMQGNLLAWSEWPVFSGVAELVCGGMRCNMDVPFVSLTPEWTMTADNGERYTLTGDMFRLSFTVSGSRGVAASIDKRLLAFSDTYEVETVDAQFPIALALLLAAIIDHKYHSDNN